jgi:hypothetical protein
LPYTERGIMVVPARAPLQAVVSLSVLLLLAPDVAADPPAFQGKSEPVPEAVAKRMRQHSWRKGCPVPISDLAYLRLAHYGPDGAVHEGELVVHKSLAAEVLEIFKALFDQRFPIAKMRLIDEYQGDDDKSVADDNTSAFNCRDVAGRPGALSKHSYGRAIDINPVENPMVLGGKISPPSGAKYLDRKKKIPGLLRQGDPAVREFTRRGWTWGGAWKDLKDYQHFVK